MTKTSKNASTGLGSSVAMFGAVAAMMTRLKRKESSSDDLGSASQHFFFSPEEEDLEQFVRSVPKVELHVHLDGAFDPYQLWQHLAKNPELIHCFPTEKELPWAKPGEKPLPLRAMVENCGNALAYRQLCTCRKRYRKLRTSPKNASKPNKKTKGSLEDMLTCFEFFFPLVYDNEKLLEDLAFDFVRRQWEQNVIYTEVRYSPHFLAKDPLKSMQAITKGLRRGCEKFSIVVNQILCAICFFPNWSNELVDLAQKHCNDFPCAVVGIDIAAGEAHFDLDSPLRQGHYDMCQRAKELGINITIHAGETPDSAENVRTAIEKYGAKRIGHGYKVATHESILELIRSRNVHIEICPTSSVETGAWTKTTWKEHPSLRFRDYGIQLSLSSDDPAVFNTSLTWQYRIALKKMGWQRQDIFSMLESAINASFVDDSEKTKLRNTIHRWKVHDNFDFEDRVHYD